MKREFVLLFQRGLSWRSIMKLLGEEISEVSSSKEEIIITPERKTKFGDCAIYVERSTAIVTKGDSKTQITYDKGSTVIRGQELLINEMSFSNIAGDKTEGLKLALKIAKKYKVILESRTHEQRVSDVINATSFGRSHVKEFSTRKVGEALHELVWWHLCGISQASAEFYSHPNERLPIRRLRVEIRKLRAVFTMMEKVLLPEVCKWQEKLRSLTIKLALTRELDVALSSWRSTALNRKKFNKNADKLSALLNKERIEELERIRPCFNLLKFTPFLLEIMIWTASNPVMPSKKYVLLEKVADKKLGSWFETMQKIVKKYPEFENDEKAHEVRIKAKTSRYVMQSMSGKAYGDNNKVMRSIKRLQDALGVMHDNYVNEDIVRGFAKKSSDAELVYQAGIFVGNERSQTLRIKKLLPELWEKFHEDWNKWYLK